MNEEPMFTEPNLSPQSVVDSQSIANCMNKNKESLKLKLMLRRPINVLVDQGILPPPKSSPSFYEQKLKLERAKTGDYLKHKIQRRPQRDELIQQHILEEAFDPSYYEQERKLKRARLADDLNERLSHRPGPLELIKGNILHTDEFLEQAIKDGQITFKKTCEGEIIKNPPKRFVFEEESSSDSAPSPMQTANQQHHQQSIINQTTTNSNQQCNITSTNHASVPTTASFIVSNTGGLVSIPRIEPTTVTIPTANLSYIVTTPVTQVQLQPNSSSPTVFITNTPNNNCTVINNQQQCSTTTVQPTITTNGASIICQQKPTPSVDAAQATTFNFGPISTSNSNKSIHSTNSQSQKTSKSKKVKSKTMPKTRVIKFHEYTGPPSAKKQGSNFNQTCPETSYELLLKQQQLFLQWQLECQSNYTQQQQQQPPPPPPPPPSSQQQSQLIKQNDNSLQNNNKIQEMNSPKNLEQSPDVSNKSNEIKANGSCNSAPKNQQSSNHEEDSNKQTINKDPSIQNSNKNGNNGMPSVKKIISKLEDMKVSDLKAELKKRNLPVSGAKQQLIERLKPFSDAVVINNNAIVTAEMNEKQKYQKATASQFVYHQDLTKPTAIILNNGSNFMATTNNDLNGKKINDNETNQFVLLTNGNVDNGTTTGHLMPVQCLKQTTNPITIDGTIPLTIPIAIPQYQVVSSTPTPASNDSQKICVNGLNGLTTATTATTNGIQTSFSNNILINNAQPTTNLNYTPTTIQDAVGSPLTILTSPRIQFTQLEDNRLSFILPTHLNNIANATATTNKLVGTIQNSPNGPVFHQLLLMPPNSTTTATARTINGNQTDINNSQTTTKHHRSNSLPSETLHPLQRNTSLPLIINQMPLSTTQHFPNVDTNSTNSTTTGATNFKLIKVSENTISMSEQIVNIKSEQNDQTSTMTLTTTDVQQQKQEVALNFNKDNSNAILQENSKSKQQKTEMTTKHSPDTSVSTNLLNCGGNESNPITVNENSMIMSDKNNCFENHSSFVDSSTASTSNNIIQQQPDSTTSNNLDFDFMLNFDDLNGFDDMATTTTSTNNCNDKSDMIMNNSNQNHVSDFQMKNTNINKNNDDAMIDFNDNWLEFTFDDNSNYLQESDIFGGNKSTNKFLLGNERQKINFNGQQQQENCFNDNLLETINQIFDNGLMTNNTNNNSNSNCKINPSAMNASNNQQIHQTNTIRYVNGNVDYVNGSSSNIQQEENQQQFNNDLNFMSNDNSNNNNQQQSSANQNLNHFNGQTTNFNVNYFVNQQNNNQNYSTTSSMNNNMIMDDSSFNDLFFEDNDFKNTALDFPILLDKIDFAT